MRWVYYFKNELININIKNFFFPPRASAVAYGGSQARGLIGAVAASQSHSNKGSEPYLQPTPQVTATLDP